MLNYNYGIILRRLNAEDLPTLYGWRNHPDNMKWFRQNDLLTWQAHCQWFDWQASDPHTEMYGMMIEGEESKGLVGVCGLTNIDHRHGKGEISIYADPKYFRDADYLNTIEAETIKSLLAHGFGSLRLHRIWAEVFIRYDRMIKLLEELEFYHEGTVREAYYKNGVWTSSVIMSTLNYQTPVAYNVS
jgi:RimJ/RimL family protein N-acetyltransferase